MTSHMARMLPGEVASPKPTRCPEKTGEEKTGEEKRGVRVSFLPGLKRKRCGWRHAASESATGLCRAVRRIAFAVIPTAIGGLAIVATLSDRPAVAQPQQQQTAAAETTGSPDSARKSPPPYDLDPLMRHPLDGLTRDPTPIIHTRPKNARLRIISWDLGTAAKMGLLDAYAEVDRAWRNTFGAEMRATMRRQAPFANLPADIVLLQNVASIRETRKIFSALHWNVVFARAIVKAERDGRPQRRPMLTAIAHRYKRGLRVTGWDDLKVASATNGADLPNNEQPLAGQAVRLSYFGHLVWLVSTHLPSHCALNDRVDEAKATRSDCPEALTIRKWQEDLRTAKDDVIVGGALRPSPKQAPTRSASQGDSPTTTATAFKTQRSGSSWFDWLFPPPKIDAGGPPPPLKTPLSAPRAEERATTPAPPDCSRLMILDADGKRHRAKFNRRFGCLAHHLLALPDQPAKPRSAANTKPQTAGGLPSAKARTGTSNPSRSDSDAASADQTSKVQTGADADNVSD